MLFWKGVKLESQYHWLYQIRLVGQENETESEGHVKTQRNDAPRLTQSKCSEATRRHIKNEWTWFTIDRRERFVNFEALLKSKPSSEIFSKITQMTKRLIMVIESLSKKNRRLFFHLFLSKKIRNGSKLRTKKPLRPPHTSDPILSAASPFMGESAWTACRDRAAESAWRLGCGAKRNQ